MVISDNDKQIKIGAVLGYVNFAVKTMIQLAYIPILLKFLGQSEYGVYQLAASIISYLSLLNFGFSGSYLRFYSQCKGDKEKESNLNGSYLIVFTFFSILALAAGLLLTFNTKLILGNNLTQDELNLAGSLMFIMTINMALSFPISVFSSIVTANECFIFQRVVELLKTIFNPMLVIIALLSGFGSVGLVIVATLLTIIGATVNIHYVLKKLHTQFKFRNINLSLMKEMGAFSFFIFLNSIIDQINWNVDKFLLGRLVGSVSIAIYSIGAQINNIYIQISDMIATVIAPKVNRIVAEEKNCIESLNNLWSKIGRIQSYLILAIVFGFIVFGREFILLWNGEEYIDAYFITLVLIISESIPLAQSLGVDIQRALNKHQYRSIVYAVLSIINLIISIPLIKHFGTLGAAIGTAIAIIIGNGIIMNILYQKILGLDVKRFWKSVIKIIPSIIPPTIAACLLNYFINCISWFTLIIKIIVFILIYFICAYFFTMNSEEKSEILKIKVVCIKIIQKKHL